MTNAEVVYNSDGTISITLTVADTNPVAIDVTVTPSATVDGGQCLSTGSNLNNAIDNYNARCDLPRADCDPYDGMWYCSSMVMTEKPSIVVSSVNDVSVTATDAEPQQASADTNQSSENPSENPNSVVQDVTPMVVSLPLPGGDGVTTNTEQSFGKIAAGDLLALHYDNAPDTDDGHALVAGRVLKDHYGIESVIAVNGTHGYQRRGNFNQNSESLFSAAWPTGLNAYRDWDGSVATSAALWSETISQGGKVWVADGGPMDFTADVLRAMPSAQRGSVTVVQHSHGWNANNTRADNLAYVDAQTNYQRIDNGNVDGNATADLNRQSDAFVQAALASQWGALWRAAFDYLSPNNKLDFSDTVEFLWLLEIPLSEVATPDDFANQFLR